MSKIPDYFSDDCPISHLREARIELERCADLEQWWQRAYQGDWLLWTAGKLGCELNLLVAAAADCAQTCQRCLPESDRRVEEAIELAKAWARGKASTSECTKYADD